MRRLYIIVAIWESLLLSGSQSSNHILPFVDLEHSDEHSLRTIADVSRIACTTSPTCPLLISLRQWNYRPEDMTASAFLYRASKRPSRKNVILKLVVGRNSCVICMRVHI